MFEVTEPNQRSLYEVAASGKLWNSECRLAMGIDNANHDQTMYRCGSPCGEHVADSESVRAGLLWHFRGCRVNTTYGVPDENIIDPMLDALRSAWVKDGKIYTAQFH
ncbi:MAG TPA: hypothetical protein H9902_12290 [Candidatus Stackebrandtia faecavium]|nr:hypothetical protein [Candidatus Stackebrandtia faecavium]